MKNIRECIQKNRLSQNDDEIAKNSDQKKKQIKESDPKLKFINLKCDENKILLDEISLVEVFRDEKTQTFPSIRSIAITKNEDVTKDEDESYITSAGDDGNVSIWKIKDDKLSCVHKQPTGQRLNTIDIKKRKIKNKTDKELLIVTGDDDNRVMLYRKNIGEINNATNCK